MTIAYLDTVGGIAGDMTMAAFGDAGLPLEDLAAELGKLGLGGFELAGRHVQRNSIRAVHIDVVVTEQPRYHRHLQDILAIIDRSGLAAGVKERAASVFRVIADAEAKVHGTTVEKVHFHELGAFDSIRLALRRPQGRGHRDLSPGWRAGDRGSGAGYRNHPPSAKDVGRDRQVQSTARQDILR